MKKVILTLLAATAFSSLATAGSSNTNIACSSASGKTVISGILPGQGETSVDLNYSVGSVFDNLSNGEYGSVKQVEVKLDAKAKSVLVYVKANYSNIEITSKDPSTTKLVETSNGTKGSFVGLLTGSLNKGVVEVRCYVTDEI